MADHDTHDHTGVTGVPAAGIPASDFTAKGDILVGTGSGTFDQLPVGANDTIPMADSGQTTGIKWVAPATPSDLDYDDVASAGTADTFSRGDHVHGMPSAGGGGGVSGKLPVNVGSATQTSSASTLVVTIVGAASGNLLIACISGIGTPDVTSIASTNTTWTLLKTSTAGASPKAEIWKGVVAGGTSGTSVTITFTGNNSDRAAVISEWNGITGTLDQHAMRSAVAAQTHWGRHSTPAILPTDANALVIAVAATTNGSVKYNNSPQFVGFEPFLVDTGAIIGYMGAWYAFPGTTPIGLAATGPTSGNYSTAICSVT